MEEGLSQCINHYFNYNVQPLVSIRSLELSVFFLTSQILSRWCIHTWALQPGFYHLVNDQGEAIKKEFPVTQ